MELKVDEYLLTPEYLERLKKQDPRFCEVDLSLQVERELRDSVVIRLILESAGEQAALALEKLAEIDPTDTNLIIRYQAKVARARFIARTLNQVLEKGKMAEQSLRDEQATTSNEGED